MKGRCQVVVIRNGKPNPNALRAQRISDDDLREELRLNGRVEQMEKVQTATMERKGKISVVPVGGH